MNDRELNKGHPGRSRLPLGLALAGAGFRAAFFHVGVLAQLARLGLLRHVEVISTVSAGSIVGALYYLHLKNLLENRTDAEISDADYVTIVQDVERELVAGVRTNIGARSLLSARQNLRTLGRRYSRSHRMGELYDEIFFQAVWNASRFGVPAPRLYQGPIQMRELIIHPAGEPLYFHPLRDNARRRATVPVLLVNATTLNTGHIWRFEASRMGEPPQAEDAPESRALINAETPNELVEDLDRNMRLRPARSYDELQPQHRDTLLGVAVAASSALPGLLPPLALLDLYPGIDVQLVDGSLTDAQGVQGLLDYGCRRFVVSNGNRGLFDVFAPSTAATEVWTRAATILLERLRCAELSRLRQAKERNAPTALMHLRKGLPTTAVPWIGSDGVADVPARERTATPSCEDFKVTPSVQEALSRIRTTFGSFTDVEASSLMLDGYRMSENELRDLGEEATEPADLSWEFEKVGPLMDRPTPEYRRQLELAAYRLGKLALRPWLRVLVAILVGAGAVAAAAALAVILVPWLLAVVTLSGVVTYLVATRPARTNLIRIVVQPLRAALQAVGAIAAPAGVALWLPLDRIALRAGTSHRLLQAKKAPGRLGRRVEYRPRSPKTVVLLLTVTAFIAGSVPLALVIGHVPLLGYLALEAALVGWLSLRAFSPLKRSVPTRTELALAWAAAVFPAGVMSLLSLAFYEGIRGAVYLVGAAVRAAGGDLDPDIDTPAFYATIWFSLTFGAAFSAQATRGTATNLYPKTAGGRSVFYVAAATRGRIVACGFATGTAVFGAAIAASLLLDSRFAWILAGFIPLATSALWQRGATVTEGPSERVVAALSDALTDAGFEVRRDPAFDRSGVDSLVRGIDLLAEGHERALAIEVKTGGRSTTPIDWTAASSVRIAASALAGDVKTTEAGPKPVEPVLILVGVTADESLEPFSRDVNVTVIRLPDAAALDLVGKADGPGRAELARVLGLSNSGDGDGFR